MAEAQAMRFPQYTTHFNEVLPPVPEPAISTPSRLVVDHTGSCEGSYLMIQDAVDEASPGDTIAIMPGIYGEAVRITTAVHVKSARGDPRFVVLECSDDHTLQFEADGGSVSGVTIMQCSANGKGELAALDIPGGTVSVENCLLSTTLGASAVRISGSAAPRITGCTVTGDGRMRSLYDRTAGEKAEVAWSLSNNLTDVPFVTDLSTFDVPMAVPSNSAEKGAPPHTALKRNRPVDWSIEADSIQPVCEHGRMLGLVHFFGTAAGLFERNHVQDHREGVGVLVESTGACTVASNRITNTFAGIVFRSGSRGTARANTIFDNVDCGVSIEDEGSCPDIVDNIITDTVKGAGVDCLNSSAGVLQGNRIASNYGPGVLIRTGANPRVTRCIIEAGWDHGVLVIDDGEGVLDHNEINENTGSGMCVMLGGNPLADSNTFSRGKGCGILVKNGGLGKFTENRVLHSSMAGVEVGPGGNPEVVSNVIQHSAQSGIHCHGAGSRGTFESNEISTSVLVGVDVSFEAAPVMLKNIILKNDQAGIFVHDCGCGSFNSNDIHSNKTVGVEITSKGAPRLYGNSIHHNLDAGVYSHDDGAGSLDSDSIFDNKAAGIELVTSTETKAAGCDIFGNLFGAHAHTSARGTLTQCHVHNNKQAGVLCETACTVLLDANVISDEVVCVLVQKKGVPSLVSNTIERGDRACIEVVDAGTNPFVSKNLVRDGFRVGVWCHTSCGGQFEENVFTTHGRACLLVETAAKPICRGNDVNCGHAEGIKVIAEGLGEFYGNSVHGNTGPGVSIATKGNPYFEGDDIFDGLAQGVLVWDTGLSTFQGCTMRANELANVEVKDEATRPTFVANTVELGHSFGVLVHSKAEGEFQKNKIRTSTKANVCVQSLATPLFTSDHVYDGHSEGVLVEKKGVGKFVQCTVSGNTAAGVRTLSFGVPALIDCTISAGAAQAVLSQHEGLGTFNDCKMFGCSKAATAEIATQANPTFTGCSVLSEANNFCLHVHTHGLSVWLESKLSDSKIDGVRVETYGDPTMTKCTIDDNQGSGIAIWDCGKGTYDRNDILSNHIHGVEVVAGGGSCLLTENRVRHNKQHGVCVWRESSATLERNELLGNVHDGVHAERDSTITLTGNKVRDNLMTGVSVHTQSWALLENNDIHANLKGGVLATSSSELIMRNNTLHHHVGKDYPAVHVTDRSGGVLESNSVTGNKGGGVLVDVQGKCTMKENSIAGNVNGSGVKAAQGGLALMHDNDVKENSPHGCHGCDRGYFQLNRNSIASNSQCGIFLETHSTATTRSNTVESNRRYGVYTASGAILDAAEDKVSQNADSGVCVSDHSEATLVQVISCSGFAEGIKVETHGICKLVECDVFGNCKAGVLSVNRGRLEARGSVVHHGDMQGFVVKDFGKANLQEDCQIHTNALAGVEACADGQVVCSDCTLSNGRSFGIYVHSDGVCRFERTKVVSHDLAGVCVKQSARVLFDSNTVSGGQQEGFLFMESAAGTVRNNTVTTNRLSGFRICSEANPAVLGNTISNNWPAGILVHSDGKGRIENNTMVDNQGAGLEVAGGGATSSCCGNTFTGNQVGVAASGPTSKVSIHGNRFDNNEDIGVSADDGCELTLTENVIESSVRCGVRLSGGCTARLSKNAISGSGENGVHIFGETDTVMEQEDIFDNFFGVRCTEATSPTITNCTIRANRHTGLVAEVGASPVVTDCDIFNNKEAGVRLQYEAKGVFTANRIGSQESVQPAVQAVAGKRSSAPITESGRYGIQVCSLSEPTIENNDFGCASAAAVFFAIDAGGVVHKNRFSRCTGAAIQILSQVSVTVTDNIIKLCTTGIAVLDGRQAILKGNDVSECSAEGILFDLDAQPLLQNHRVHHCSGVGVRVEGGSSGRMEDNELDHNSVGMSIRSHSRTLVENNRFHHNHLALEVSTGEPEVVSNSFVNNYHSIVCTAWSYGTIRQNTICSTMMPPPPVPEEDADTTSNRLEVNVMAVGHNGMTMAVDIVAPVLQHLFPSPDEIYRPMVGIIVETGSHPMIIDHNSISGCAEVGVLFRDRCRGVLDGNVVTACGGYGIMICGGGDPKIRNNNVNNCHADGLIMTSHLDVMRNRYEFSPKEDYGVSRGVFSEEFQRAIELDMPQEGGRGMISNNEFSHCRGAGVHVGHGSDGSIENNDCHHNGVAGLAFIYGSGLSDTNSLHDNDVGLLVRRDSEPKLHHDICTLNRIGFLFNEGGGGTLSHEEVRGNIEVGIEISRGGHPLVSCCNVHDHTKFGIRVDDSGKGDIIGNNIFDNGLAGMMICNEGEPQVLKNFIRKNQHGIIASAAGPAQAQENVIEQSVGAGVIIKDAFRSSSKIVFCKNHVHDNEGGGFLIEKGGGGRVLKNQIQNNGGNGVTIKGSCTVHESQSPDMVEGNSITDHTKGAGVAVDGKDADHCLVRYNRIISNEVGLFVTNGGGGDLNNNNVVGSTKVSCVVSGGASGSFLENSLTTVDVQDGSNPTFEKCVFTIPDTDKGGVHRDTLVSVTGTSETKASASFHLCIFKEVHVDCVLRVADAGAVLLQQNRFNDCTGDTIVLEGSGSSGRMSGNRIWGTSGVALTVKDSAAASLNGNNFQRNGGSVVADSGANVSFTEGNLVCDQKTGACLDIKGKNTVATVGGLVLLRGVTAIQVGEGASVNSEPGVSIRGFSCAARVDTGGSLSLVPSTEMFECKTETSFDTQTMWQYEDGQEGMDPDDIEEEEEDEEPDEDGDLVSSKGRHVLDETAGKFDGKQTVKFWVRKLVTPPASDDEGDDDD